MPTHISNTFSKKINISPHSSNMFNLYTTNNTNNYKNQSKKH